MSLEHYPGMTEAAIEDIVAQARGRWDLYAVLVVHRVGELAPTDQIVLVAVTARIAARRSRPASSSWTI